MKANIAAKNALRNVLDAAGGDEKPGKRSGEAGQ